MKNKLTLSTTGNSKPFLQEITYHLSTNLTEKLIKTLSNILALDYANRLKSEPPVEVYIPLCIRRLQNYLGYKIITDEDFATGMRLFCVAITPEKDTANDISSQEQVQDAAVDAVIDMHFGDLPKGEREAIKLVLKGLFSGKDGHEISNFLNSNPKLFHCILIGAIREKKKQQEITEFVKLHINRFIIESNSVDKKIGKLRNLGSKFSLAATLMAVASAGLAIGGLILPAFMIPATAVSVKYAPKAGEKVGEIVAGNIETIQNHKETLAEVKSAVIDLSGKTNSITQILAQGQGASLENIRERLQQQRMTISNDTLKKKSHAMNIQEKAGQEQKVSQTRIR
jgi:hypothetical protein